MVGGVNMNFQINEWLLNNKWLLENYIMPLLVLITGYISKLIFTKLFPNLCDKLTNSFKKNILCLTNWFFVSNINKSSHTRLALCESFFLF